MQCLGGFLALAPAARSEAVAGDVGRLGIERPAGFGLWTKGENTAWQGGRGDALTEQRFERDRVIRVWS